MEEYISGFGWSTDLTPIEIVSDITGISIDDLRKSNKYIKINRKAYGTKPTNQMKNVNIINKAGNAENLVVIKKEGNVHVYGTVSRRNAFELAKRNTNSIVCSKLQFDKYLSEMLAISAVHSGPVSFIKVEPGYQVKDLQQLNFK